MISEEKIRYYLDTFTDLRAEDLLKLLSMSRQRQLAGGDVYIREGVLHKKLSYITRGLIRVYALTDSGSEITLQLHWEDRFFASRDSVLLHRPSRFTYQALEPTTLLEVDFDEAQQLFDTHPQFTASRHFFLLNMLSESMERVEDFVLLTPEQRYLKMVHNKPDIINRVPAKYIATILGITPVSLSRIRKRIATRQTH